MAFAVSHGDLEAAFGAAHVTTIPPDRLNPAVTHPDSRRFLAEVGLPTADRFLYAPLECLTSGLPNAVDFDPGFGYLEVPPKTVEHWVGLGFCQAHRIFLDGATGIVWLLPDGESEAYVLNTRLDLFARCLCSVRRRWDVLAGPTDIDLRTTIVDELAATFAALDPAAINSPETTWRYWGLSDLADY
ncbi:SUKH-4 family immunity protein [Streptomyces sp. NBRC 109706]|uniref:SUKH-4 family immunity protein n=1 Tax=Streptomyces sp. NBRC 109706 TaxID=1550035 RepID=UPI000780F4AD|nr:SUKH-4 family immunity protein [Streptomyces sp. NBRC 109706]